MIFNYLKMSNLKSSSQSSSNKGSSRKKRDSIRSSKNGNGNRKKRDSIDVLFSFISRANSGKKVPFSPFKIETDKNQKKSNFRDLSPTMSYVKTPDYSEIPPSKSP